MVQPSADRGIEGVLHRLERSLSAEWWPGVFLFLIAVVTAVSYDLALIVPVLWPAVVDDPSSFWSQLRFFCLGWDATTGRRHWQYPAVNLLIALAFSATIGVAWPQEVGRLARSLLERVKRPGGFVKAAGVAVVLLTPPVLAAFSPLAGPAGEGEGIHRLAPRLAPGFRLVDQDGAVFQSDLALRGHHTLIAFLYADCTVACPTAIARMKRALAAMPGNGDARAVVVTVNPVRDTPERLRRQMELWDVRPPRWRFLTGDPAAVGAVLREYRVPAGGWDPVTRTLPHQAVGLLLDGSGRTRYRIDLSKADPGVLTRVWSDLQPE